MSLTNSQYEQLIREYEEKQNMHRHIQAERQAFVYEHIDGYKELDESTASLSADYTKKLIDGSVDSMEDLHSALHALSDMKRHLLVANHLSETYLEPEYDCPDCKDTGYIGSQKCHCFKQKIISLLYAQSNIKQMLEQENFTTLSYSYYNGEDLTRFKNAVSTCQTFLKDFDGNYRNLFFFGTVGCGKSFLSGCVAKELIESGHSVIYFSAKDLFDELSKCTFDNKNKENLYSLYEDLYNCDLVIVDDLGTELTNNFVTSHLFSFLNERHLRKKSTIISTNLSLEELRDRYSERIFSRITSFYDVCKLSGPDIRIYKKSIANRK